MANDLSARPWFIDTPSTTAIIWQPQAFVKFIEWVLPATTGDTFEVTDRNGKSIVKSQAQVASDIQTFNLENWFEGIIIKSLTSGTLRIHIK